MARGVAFSHIPYQTLCPGDIRRPGPRTKFSSSQSYPQALRARLEQERKGELQRDGISEPALCPQPSPLQR